MSKVSHNKGQPMDIEKSNDNFKDKKPKYFNYNKYGHMVKECQKKEKETRKCFKCDKEGHIAKDYKGKQSIKKQKIQEESENKDNKENDKKQDFGEVLEQVQYKRSPLWILRTNILFLTDGVMLRKN